MGKVQNNTLEQFIIRKMLFTEYYEGDQTKANEKGEICSTHRKDGKWIQICFINLCNTK
jgi:hypothetical protein